MKRGIMICLLILWCGSSIGCGSVSEPDSAVSQIVSDDVTTVSVSHIVGGQMTVWEISGGDVEEFMVWLHGLNYRREQFSDGDTPGDMDGGELYGFALLGKTDSEISYIINGPDECYLLITGEWYRVENPSDPPAEPTENAGNYGVRETMLSRDDAGDGNERNGGDGSSVQPEDGGETDMGQNDEWGLTLRAESVSAEGCTLVFTRNGGASAGELTSGSWYRIEKKEDDEWVELPHAPGMDGELAWTCEAWLIPYDGSIEFEIDWSFLYGGLPSGTYRMVKEITGPCTSGEYGPKWYYAEFIIEGETIQP